VSEADPRARGSVIGSALAGPIGANVQRYLGYFAALGLSSDQVQEYGVAALDPISTWAPALGEELLGIAEGADLPVWQVAALNARTEIIAVARRLAADSGQAPATVAECSTSVFLLDRHPPRTIQTWDWLDTVRPDKVVLRLTGGRHTVVVFTEAGIVGKVGVNSAGLGVHLNMLSHLTDGVGMGVPVHVVARHLLDDAASLRRALVLAHSADVSASTVLTVSSWDGRHGGAMALELSPAGLGIIEPTDGHLAHANHFLDPVLAQGEATTNRTDTFARQEFLELRAPELGAAEPTQRAAALIGHTDEHTAPVCSHPNPQDVDTDRSFTQATICLELDVPGIRYADTAPCLLTAQSWRRVAARQ
jgi:isopenicillin-N N-acyltransferase-like protein